LITFHQWAHLFKSAYKAKGLKAKCKAVLGYPTSRVKDKAAS
jgi:hypothetical protein